MPTLPNFTGISNGDPMRILDLYQSPGTGGIYARGDTSTLEVLHGGLDADNFTGTIPPETIQTGALVAAGSVAFGDFDALYGSQLPTGGDTLGQTLARLACDFEIPWDASLVLVAWQVFAQQDATLWGSGTGSEFEEVWNLYTLVDHLPQTEGLSCGLPPTRGTIDASGGGAHDPGMSSEGRWRWAQGFRFFTGWGKGTHTMEVKVRAKIQGDDPLQVKLSQACGSLVWLALR